MGVLVGFTHIVEGGGTAQRVHADVLRVTEGSRRSPAEGCGIAQI